jgi:hypothetical protein
MTGSDINVFGWLASPGVFEDGGGVYCLEGVCMNARIEVDGVAGQAKENRVCVDINNV